MTRVRPLAAALLVAACTTPVVDVRRADVVDVYRSMTSYALNDGKMSDQMRVTFERAGLVGKFQDDPVGAIRELHADALLGDRRERLYALAEASHLAARRLHDRSLFLASVVYAHLFLFGGGDESPPGPFDQRFHRACDLYDVGLALAFTDDSSEEFAPTAGRVALPVGAVDVVTPTMPLRIAGFAYDQLRPAILMQVEGLRARDVRSGLGAPLVARRRDGTAAKESRAHLSPRSTLAVTALLRLDGELDDLSKGALRGTFEFHLPTDDNDVRVAGRDVPLEFDLTAPLAWGLAKSKPWENEFASFFHEDAADVTNKVYLTEPYRPGCVPVVFIHGTESSPSRWAEALNELHDDELIASKCQFWTYQYASGEPILASAAGLRLGLDRVARNLDPDGKDPAMRRMVLVGHSQGGLLARLTVSTSDDVFWKTITTTAFADLPLSDSARKYFGATFFFDPSPYVARVVYVATPHCGSFVAGGWIGSLFERFISVPKAVVRGVGRLAKGAVGAKTEINAANFSTAVDDMTPGSAFLDALAASAMSKSVPDHSIVAVDGDGPVEDGDDGVVRYVSAHLPSAVSEVVVRSPHSCQGHPAVVAEIRRILRAHISAPPPAPKAL